MQTKVLITGLGGFVSVHVLEHILSNTDWKVIGISSWRHKGLPERVQEVLKGDPSWPARVEIITHDLISPLTEMTKKRIGYCDYILNIASESHVDRSITDPVPFVQNNVNLALNMLEFAREYPPKKFIQFSTDEVYGVAPDGVNHKEWSEIIPSNPYSASKAAQEALAIAYWRTYGLPIIITNCLNIFGEMQDQEKYIAKAIRCVVRGETLTVHGREGDIGSRFYVHARNVADAILHLIKNVPVLLYDGGQNLKPERFNIVTKDELNNLEVAKTIAEIIGKELKYELTDWHSIRPGHDRRYALCGDKLAASGWTAPFSFRDSLEKSIKWTIKNDLWL